MALVQTVPRFGSPHRQQPSTASGSTGLRAHRCEWVQRAGHDQNRHIHLGFFLGAIHGGYVVYTSLSWTPWFANQPVVAPVLRRRDRDHSQMAVPVS